MSKFLKSKMSMLLIGLMMFSGVSSFADSTSNLDNSTTAPVPMLISAPVESTSEQPVPTLYTDAVPTLYNEAVPTLYNDVKVPFEVRQDGDNFTIILDENPSTGFAWTYVVKKENHVDVIGEEFIAPSSEEPVVGAGGQKEFSFKVNGDGVSTIEFKYARSWEDEALETLTVLVYKNGEKVFVEEDQIVTIMDETSDSVEMTKIQDGAIENTKEVMKIYYNDDEISTEMSLEIVDGITMVPLSSTLKAIGYDIVWNGETRSVEINKGAQWTSIKIGENAYFRNRMAPSPLSAAPVIIDGYTYVPAEFMAEILGLGVQVENGSLKLSDFESAIHSGYVLEISQDETGTKTITLGNEKDTTDYMNMVIIHTSEAYTYYNKDVKVGEFVKVVSPLMMTMSIPGQTSGYIIY